MKNQCDGCNAGIPIVNGNHRMGREGGYPDLMGCTAKQYAEVMEAAIVAPREMLRRAADILGSQGFSAWDGLAADIRTLLASPEQASGFTAVDMGTAASDGRRSLAEHLIKQIAIEHPDQDTLLTVKYIAQWIALEAGL